MTLGNLVPWRKNKGLQRGSSEYPLAKLQRQMNRMFDDFFSGADLSPFFEKTEMFMPKVNVSENDKQVKVSAELPGIDEKDIELSMEDGILTIRGEKKQEHEDNDKQNGYYYESSYGSFSRSIDTGSEVDEDNIDANFKKGVLTITLPKKESAREKTKKISIKSG
jgi:HSP20 family protein